MSTEPSNNIANVVSISSSLLIEAVDDGALVFDLNSGATTLINGNAFNLLNILQGRGKIPDLELIAAFNGANQSGVDINDVLAMLEKTQLISRC